MSNNKHVEAHTSTNIKAIQEKPGKPSCVNVEADVIDLCWTPVEDQSEVTHYQIRYKDVDQDTRWKILPTEFPSASAKIPNLRANAKYQFQVRAVYGDDEGPYSQASDDMVTVQSPAAIIVQSSIFLKDGEPALYSLPMTEVKKARNEGSKTRKFDIGTSSKDVIQEKIIMLVGATGTGKSTLVDGIVNYILGVKWNDPFRFTIERLESDEAQKKGNQAISMTEWITCYTIHPEKGSRLRYKLTIIDTPGFGDTRGLERDDQTVEQIRGLFSATDGKGVVCLDAICFLMKAPDARLTVTQAYIFNAILSLFGNDVKDNIRTLITFADGMDPPVLAAIQHSKLPFGKHFTFNNSGLFASNKSGSSALSPMFWEMGATSFQEFFKDIGTLSSVSLSLTKEVLEERRKVELTLLTLQPQVSAGLAKLAALKKEQQVIEQHELEISSNKDFTYESMEPKVVQRNLNPGIHTTTCLICNFTCHENCALSDNNDKAYCCAMNSSGNCEQCPRNCIWREHKNTPFVIEIVQVKVSKTYEGMKKQYEIAEGKKLSAKQLLDKLSEEYQNLQDAIEMLMSEINQSKNRLTEIALRPNPLSMVEHLDLMIKTEEIEKKDGYQERIECLKMYRSKATIGDDVDRLKREAQAVDCLKGRKAAQPGIISSVKAVVHKMTHKVTQIFTKEEVVSETVENKTLASSDL